LKTGGKSLSFVLLFRKKIIVHGSRQDTNLQVAGSGTTTTATNTSYGIIILFTNHFFKHGQFVLSTRWSNGLYIIAGKNGCF
jgi:hypothetical protein